MDRIDPDMLNGHEPEHNHNSNSSITPDALRAPQRNPRVTGHGGSSQGCQDINEGGDNTDDSDVDFIRDHDRLHQDAFVNGDISDDEDDEPVIGQEGVEENQIRTPGCRCSCHERTWTNGPRLLNPSPPNCSGMHSRTSSTMGEYDGSGDRTLDNSTIWSPPSPSTSEFDTFIHSLLIDERAFESTSLLRFSLVYKPLSLNPEVGFARSMDGPAFYPTHLSFHNETNDMDDGRSLGR